MKINTKVLSLTLGIMWGGSILFVGLLNLLWPSYGKIFLELVASIYPGYHPVSSLGQVIVATGYGLVDGAIGGLIFGWLYNLFAKTRGGKI